MEGCVKRCVNLMAEKKQTKNSTCQKKLYFCVRKKSIIQTKIIMKDSIAEEVRQHIHKKRRGHIFFIQDFVNHDSGNIGRILSRLVEKGELVRLSSGIYYYPKLGKFGTDFPTLNQIAHAVAQRDHVEIMPTGATAQNMLGFSTQVPMNAVYLTTGSPRTIVVGKRKISFVRAVPKNFAYKSELMPLIVASYKEMGKDGIDDSVLSRTAELIKGVSGKDRELLAQDLTLAPKWIRDILLPLVTKD